MCEPDLGRVLGDIEVNDPLAVVAEDDHGVEQPKTSRSQQRTCRWPPCRPCGCAGSCARSGRRLRVAMNVPADGGLAHYDTELEQLAVDAACGPQRIGDADFADQITGLPGRLG